MSNDCRAEVGGFRRAVECLYKATPRSKRAEVGERFSRILSEHDLGTARKADAYVRAGLVLLAASALRRAGIGTGRGLESMLLSCAEELAESMPPEARQCLELVKQYAESLVTCREALLDDLFGNLYRDAMGELGERRSYATYYTEPPAAHLLATLAFHALAINSRPRRRTPRIVDFACGTGMLLQAAYRAVRDSWCRGGGCTSLVEEIYGFEAQRFAASLASVSLRLLEPGSPSGPKILVTPLDAEKGLLGSLELLETWPPGVPGSFDLVIMNPPFTSPTGRSRSAGRSMFGFAGSEASRLLTRYRELLERRVARELRPKVQSFAQKAGFGELDFYMSRLWRAGEALAFLYLAYRHVKEGGVIAFVLPRSILTGASWLPIRILLASELHVEYVVVSSDPVGGYGFSVDAHDSEVLLVVRKSRGGSGPAVFINLLSKPTTVREAAELAARLAEGSSGLVTAGSAKALVVKFPQGSLRELVHNWGVFVSLPDPELVDDALSLISKGTIRLGSVTVRIPVARLGGVARSIGVDRHQFHDEFKPSSGAGLPGLFGGGEDIRARMVVEPNVSLRAGPRGEELFHRYAGRVLVPDRIRWDTAHVVALYSQTPLLANMFYAVRLRGGENAEKALVYWLNTTWGMLTVLAYRSETEGAWSNIKLWQWRLLPVLDVTRLDADVLEKLANLLDKHGTAPLRRIPCQFSGEPSRVDKARLEIDLDLLRTLAPGIDVEEAEKALLQLYGRIELALKAWLSQGRC